jgi:glucosamine-6-phosphate deaminase
VWARIIGQERDVEPKTIIAADDRDMGRRAANIVAATLVAKPGAAISLPTGSTPLPLFEELIERQRRGELDLSRFHLFCLDEYLGVDESNPNTLTSWLRRMFIEPAGLPAAHVHTLPVTDPDPEAAAARYEESIRARGGLELAVLGISENGHIAYNEPGSSVDSRTRVVSLTPESVEQAAGYFGGARVPDQAMTVGIATLLEARQIILIAAGEEKQEILLAALRGPISSEVPASFLRTVPERVTVVLDEAAAGLLR